MVPKEDHRNEFETVPSRPQDRETPMLIEMAVADAFAVAWEFTDEQTATMDLTGYHQHPKYAELKPGMYTDDTQRAIANAQVVLLGEQACYDPAAYALAYVRSFREDPREGWSRRFQDYLRQNAERSPDVFMKGIRRRATNGSLMGVAPLGFLPDENAVRLATAMQVISTHSGTAIPYAQMISLSCHFLLRGGARRDLADHLAEAVEWPTEDECGSDERAAMLHKIRTKPPIARMPARTIAPAAVWAAMNMDSLADIIRWAVDHGKDTDSLAATAVAIASCAHDIDLRLPAALLDGLETPEARDRLTGYDEALRDLLVR